MNDIIIRLRDKDDKAACEYAKQLGAESAASDRYLCMIPEFAEMLTDKNSYVRTRGFGLICNQARWADNGQIELGKYKDSMSPLIEKDMKELMKVLA